MITRDISGAAARTHDVAIVGGGIHGACLALEAARNGLRPLLVERGDFGGATSWNSLRILHGGLRYLQTLDVRRFRESVSEQAWFCRTFPELVRPLDCLMPLYGRGLKRPFVFSAALRANRVLARMSAGTLRDTFEHHEGVLDAAGTIARFPMVDREGLLGAALWSDAAIVSPQRILIESLRWACGLGATALNYVEATDLVVRSNRVEGLRARDMLSGRTHTFAARTVCNCAGPWSAALASRLDRDVPALFRPSLAFNLLLDCEPLSTSAVAVTPGRGDGPVYFLYPASGGMLAGTAHRRWDEEAATPVPRDSDVQQFLGDLNTAVPGLGLRRSHVRHVFAGLLPAVARGTTRLSTRARIVNHSHHGGPMGLVSVSGVKFTTARRTAERALALMAHQIGRTFVRNEEPRPAPIEDFDINEPDQAFGPGFVTALRRLAREESVMTPDDLILRRTNWGFLRDDLATLRRRVARAIEGVVPDCAPSQPASAEACDSPVLLAGAPPGTGTGDEQPHLHSSAAAPGLRPI